MEQRHLVEIFNKLKKELKRYENPLKSKLDLDSRYDLWSFNDLEIAGRRRKEVFFASVVIQRNYVGFYYMPVYTDVTLKDVFQPDLLKLLKGKSCFHIKTLDPDLLAQIKRALKIGYDLYKSRGWV